MITMSSRVPIDIEAECELIVLSIRFAVIRVTERLRVNQLVCLLLQRNFNSREGLQRENKN